MGKCMKLIELIENSNKLDVVTPSIEQIAKKHNVPLNNLKSQLKKGIAVELEHTSDEKVAEEIALDHLNELPDYYDKLDKVERTP